MFVQNLLPYTSIRGGQYRPYTSKALGFTALEDLAEAAAVILMEGPEKHSGKDYFFSADAKGGFEFFRYVEDGRMAYVGTVRDDTKKILGREPLLLREWAKVHANELLEIAGS